MAAGEPVHISAAPALVHGAQTGCVELLPGTFVFDRVTNSSQTVPRVQVLLLGSLKWILAAQRRKVCRNTRRDIGHFFG